MDGMLHVCDTTPQCITLFEGPVNLPIRFKVMLIGMARQAHLGAPYWSSTAVYRYYHSHAVFGA